jgi:hypothetical protein
MLKYVNLLTTSKSKSPTWFYTGIHHMCFSVESTTWFGPQSTDLKYIGNRWGKTVPDDSHSVQHEGLRDP